MQGKEMFRKITRLLLVLPLVATASSQVHSQDSPADKNRRILQEAVAYPSDKAKVDAFIATLIEVPAGSGRYLVEGDLPLAREEIGSYLKGLKYPEKTTVKSQELVVNLVGGRFDYLSSPGAHAAPQFFAVQIGGESGDLMLSSGASTGMAEQATDQTFTFADVPTPIGRTDEAVPASSGLADEGGSAVQGDTSISDFLAYWALMQPSGGDSQG